MSRLACLVLAAASLGNAADRVTLNSPNGAVQLRISAYGGLRLGYEVTFRKKPVVEASALGIVVDGVPLGEAVELGRPERYQTDQTYPWHGVHATARDHSHGLRLPLKAAKAGLTYTLEARAYHDGIAFRWIVPGESGKSRVPDEATAFRLPAGSVVWYHDFEGHYEGIPTRKSLSDVVAGDWAAPPLTYKLSGGAGYASITEGALFRYSGMGLQADGQGGFVARLGHLHPASYPFRLRYAGDVVRMTKPAAVTGTITTPWRIVMVGADLNALVNCDIVHNVAPPPDSKLFPKGLQTEWIKPGRAVWRYLDGGDTSLEGIKEFSRLAGELGFEYQVVEGFWRKWSEPQLRELIEYSRSQGVGIWLWRHSRELRDPASRRQFFELCRKVGAAGVKLDFYDHEAKEVVELYEAALRDAAEYGLLVNFHGANKPTGESRTYPNELTREAIKGMEGRPVPRAALDTTLPFTRMLAGHADYTPVHFGERRSETSWAHQVATAAIYTSPLLTYGAHPKAMLEHPAAGMIKSIPSVWDETLVLPFSEIGEVAAFARRRGDTWFVAILNGPQARTVQVPLSFLGAGRYRALSVRDDKMNPAAVWVEEASVERGESLRIDLREAGGFIGRYSR
jgi:alpha-glucosidase